MRDNFGKQIVESEQYTSDFQNSWLAKSQHQKAFQNKVIQYNALTCRFGGGNFDSKTAISESQDSLIALGAQGGLQEMLAAQLTTLHVLQQSTAALAQTSTLVEHKICYINAAVKLTNSFAQIAGLMSKLQGKGNQKIVVEHLEVKNGGQALVANINRGAGTMEDNKK